MDQLRTTDLDLIITSSGMISLYQSEDFKDKVVCDVRACETIQQP